MKKIFLVAAMAAVVLTSVNAQNKYKPENMSFSTELNYSPGGATTDGQFSLPDYGAKVRLHLNEKMAVRLKLGLNTSTDKDVTYYESPTDQKEYERNSKESITTFSIMPGFEYHFTKYERISPYVGGEVESGITLASGDDYKVRVTAGDSVAASFDRKFYAGEEPFVIAKGQQTTVNVTCNIANALVKVNFDKEFDTYLKSAEVNVAVDAENGGLNYQWASSEEAAESPVGYYTFPQGKKYFICTLTE